MTCWQIWTARSVLEPGNEYNGIARGINKRENFRGEGGQGSVRRVRRGGVRAGDLRLCIAIARQPVSDNKTKGRTHGFRESGAVRSQRL